MKKKISFHTVLIRGEDCEKTVHFEAVDLF